MRWRPRTSSTSSRPMPPGTDGSLPIHLCTTRPPPSDIGRRCSSCSTERSRHERGCRMLTDRLPRVRLGHLPTPLHELPRLSQALGGPRLFVKRDDQTGLAAGGNKTRKLEFIVGEALRRDADTLIALGAVQSNHVRQTAAAAAACGLRCIAVLGGDAPPVATGNLLLDHLLGARIVFAGKRDREQVAEEIVSAETAAGRRPYLIPYGGSDEVGAAGFVAALEELKAQLDEIRIRADRVVFASSSFGTQAGLCVGAKSLGFEARLVGIAIDSTRAELQAA